MAAIGNRKANRAIRTSKRFIDDLVNSGKGPESKNMKKGIGYRGRDQEEDFAYKIIFSTFSPYTLDPIP